ncbi:DUF2550 domain-containing protein [Nocardiopsis sp. N85]|uniref:DUF2550 domain-containing protein n=1 Tax=Nocardiopsis sp. N85 TaxID=3029400 RepID=UPI00237F636C|nr:DUF2550 domain-containing protein [Nocardiopsis sp. N85]MDE3724793.1 DUF2550 domain-containing protein [Nocardiopsis sp. N85]
MEQPLEFLRWALLALVLCAVAVVCAGLLRRRLLLRRGGTVECHLRSPGMRGRRGSWRIGLCRYGSENLGWFPAFSIRPRPTAELSRRGLVIVGRRSPEPAEHLPSDVTVVQVGWAAQDGREPKTAEMEIAMNDATLTGFLSWMESMPPGTRWEA